MSFVSSPHSPTGAHALGDRTSLSSDPPWGRGGKCHSSPHPIPPRGLMRSVIGRLSRLIPHGGGGGVNVIRLLTPFPHGGSCARWSDVSLVWSPKGGMGGGGRGDGRHFRLRILLQLNDWASRICHQPFDSVIVSDSHIINGVHCGEKLDVESYMLSSHSLMMPMNSFQQAQRSQVAVDDCQLLQKKR